jgi:hypothetical protein
MSNKRSKSTYKREMKQEGETLITGIMHLRRAFPNGLQDQALGYLAKLPFLAAGMDDEYATKSNF